MKEIFASFYELFSRLGFYNTDLGLYLYGFDCTTGTFERNSLYPMFGWIMILGSIIMAALFYYIINHPRFNKWTHWLLILGISSLFQYAIPYFTLSDHLEVGRICGDLIVHKSDISGFAFTNLFLALVIYIFASFVMRWWSRNGSCTPYPL